MSQNQTLAYEFRLLKPRPGEDPGTTARRESAAWTDSPPDPQKEALKHQVANLLAGAKLGLRLSELPFGQIARYEQIPEELARRKYRHLELSTPEGGSGLQVFLRDEEVQVLIPLWHEGPKATEVFKEVWACLDLIRQATSYFCFDPQLDRVLEPAAGFDEALARYAEKVRESRARISAPHPREEPAPLPVEIRKLTVSPDSEVVLVALHESGVLSGFARVSIEPVRGNGALPVARLNGWYVTPEFRGHGVGRQLRQSAEAWAAAHGLRGLAVNGHRVLLKTPLRSGSAENAAV